MYQLLGQVSLTFGACQAFNILFGINSRQGHDFLNAAHSGPKVIPLLDQRVDMYRLTLVLIN